MEQWFADLKASPAVSPSGMLDLGMLCEQYLEWDRDRVKTKQRDANGHKGTRIKLKRACALFVENQQVGAILIDQFTAGNFEGILDRLRAEGLKDGYLREIGSAIKTVFQWATRDTGHRTKLIQESPVKDCKLPVVPIAEHRFAERVEAVSWLQWLRHRVAAKKIDHSFLLLQRCLIYTGARPSEWAWARWPEINWATGRLVREEWKAGKKTGKVRRIIIPRRLRRTLRRAYDRAKSKNDLMFTTRRGNRWTSSNLSTVTQRYRDAAIKDGILLADVGPDRLTNYRWRHTAISTLLMEGVDVATVAEMTGTSIIMIQRHYGHLLAGHLDAAAEKLGRRR
jgi:integrase